MLSTREEAALHILATAAENRHTLIVDADEHNLSSNVLASLKKKRLAQKIDDRLWRASLSGYVLHQFGIASRYAVGGLNRDAILEAVKERPGSTTRDLAELAGVSKGSANNTLTNLARVGAVERYRAPGEMAFRYRTA